MTTRPHPEWVDDLRNRSAALHGYVAAKQDLVDANIETVTRSIAGQGPDKGDPVPELGAHMVVNIAAVHVPSFCNPPPGSKAYLNGYDLGKFTRFVGTPPPGAKVREQVDAILATLTGQPSNELYFGAIELNGSGIRFYGDICLVLATVPNGTVILSSNSYDLVRPPMTPRGTVPDPSAMAINGFLMSGRWGIDATEMAALKVLASLNVTERRLTIGQISSTVLNDEDYLEVLRVGTFTHTDIPEARVAATDAAAEAQIGEHLRLGPTPTLAELQWRKHRRAAAQALRDKGIPFKVVTTSGRVRP